MLNKIWSMVLWNDNLSVNAMHNANMDGVKQCMGYHMLASEFHKRVREKYGENPDATKEELCDDLNECYDNLTQYNDGVMEYIIGINTAYAELKLAMED